MLAGVPTGAPLRYTRYCHTPTSSVDALHVKSIWVGATADGAKPVGTLGGPLSVPVTPICTVSVTTAPDAVRISRVITCMPVVIATAANSPVATTLLPSIHVQEVICPDGDTLARAVQLNHRCSAPAGDEGLIRAGVRGQLTRVADTVAVVIGLGRIVDSRTIVVAVVDAIVVRIDGGIAHVQIGEPRS